MPEHSEAPPPQRPDNLGFLLREPFRVGSDLLHERFAERGHPEVRAPHGNVFQFLDESGTRVSVLAQRAQVTKQSMAELVRHLESRGYIERVPDPTDRRAKLVRATARGREIYAIAREFVEELEADWAERIGEAKMNKLRVLLKDLNNAVVPSSR